MTHLAFSWPGFIMTASIGWNSGVPESYVKTILPTLLDIHLFGQCGFNLDGTPMKSSGGSSAGSALVDLGKAEACLDFKRSLKHVVSKVSADSTLLRILMAPDDVILEQLAAEDFGATVQQVKKAQNYLIKSQAGKEIRFQALKQELLLTSELLILSARIGRSLIANGSKDDTKTVINVGIANLPPTFRTDIANKALVLVEQYRALWLSRYEPQGMQSSLLVLSNLLNKFIPEGAQL